MTDYPVKPMTGDHARSSAENARRVLAESALRARRTGARLSRLSRLLYGIGEWLRNAGYVDHAVSVDMAAKCLSEASQKIDRSTAKHEVS
jgi:hypothetical protein